jgi:hypothetical protein
MFVSGEGSGLLKLFLLLSRWLVLLPTYATVRKVRSPDLAP